MKSLTALWICSAMACLAQVTVSLSNGVSLRIETSLGHPTGEQIITAEMKAASGNSFYRLFRDQNGLAVFAYKLLIDRPGEDEYRLILQPAGSGLGDQDNGKPTPTFASDRVLDPLEPGTPVPIEVFNLAGMGLNVVDTVTFETDPNQHATGGPMVFAGLKVYLNQTLVSNQNSAAVVSGRYVMFYVPGRGGYFFATRPEPGFVEAGSVDGRRMQFTLDNVSIECTTDQPILGRNQAGEIWVRHDQNYKPQGRWTEPLGSDAAPGRAPGFFDAASNTLSWWLP